MRNPRLILVLLLGSVLTGCWQAAPETPIARGKAFFEAGDWDQAISAFGEAIARNPLDAEAFLYRGQAYMCRGREHVGQALADYSEAIRIDPHNFEAHYHRAIAYRERGEKQKALADELIARRLDPNAAKAALMRSAPTPEEYKAAFERAAEDERGGTDDKVGDAVLETVPDIKSPKTTTDEAPAVAVDRKAAKLRTSRIGGVVGGDETQDAYGLPAPPVRIGSVTEDLLGLDFEKSDRGDNRRFRSRAAARGPQPDPDWQNAPPPLTQPSAPASPPAERRASPVGTLPFGNPYQPRSNTYSPYSTGPRSTGIRSNEPTLFDPNLRGGIPNYGSRRYDPNAVQRLPNPPGG